MRYTQNGLIRKEDAFKKIHLGAKLEAYTFIDWSKDTKRKNLELIQSQIKDCVNRFISKEYLGNWVSELVNVGEKSLKHPAEVVKNIGKSLALYDSEIDQILGYFIEAGVSNAFGVSQSITHFAHETNDADLQFEMESAGLDILYSIQSFDHK